MDKMNAPANTLYSGWCSNQWWLLVSQPADDRRQEPRVAVGEDVSLTGSTHGAPTRGQLVNLSPIGALVLPNEPFDIGTVLGLRFELANNRVLQCAAIVRTCLHEQANGVAFLGLSAGDRCWIDNRVRRSAHGEGPPPHSTGRESSLATPSPRLASQVENAVRSFIYERDHAWSGALSRRRRMVA
jgi:hypothetical protein